MVRDTVLFVIGRRCRDNIKFGVQRVELCLIKEMTKARFWNARANDAVMSSNDRPVENCMSESSPTGRLSQSTKLKVYFGI